MNRVVIGLGSNIEEPLTQLAGALKHLGAHPDVLPTKLSRIYLSAPVGPQDQPDFYNAAVVADTTLTPEALLQWLLDVELEMGRQRHRHWGERCIDLDLLLFDDLEMQTASLVVPHPRAHQRRFVLDPLIELLGEVTCCRARARWEYCRQSARIRRFAYCASSRSDQRRRF